MKTWRGLWRKEWAMLKWSLLTLFLSNIVIVVGGPLLINQTFDLPLNTFENTLILTGVWFVLNLFVSGSVLLISLEKEMKQLDTWLHSPVSIGQLIGSKAVFAAVVTALSIALGGSLLILSFFVSDAYGVIAKSSGALSLLSVMISIFLKSIYFMGLSFIAWALYQVGRSRFMSISVVFTKLLLFAGIFTGTVIAELARRSKVLTAIKEFGPVKLTNLPFYTASDSYYFTGIVSDGVAFTVGGLLFYGLLTLICFAVGAKLFEKKVRL